MEIKEYWILIRINHIHQDYEERVWDGYLQEGEEGKTTSNMDGRKLVKRLEGEWEDIEEWRRKIWAH